MKIADTEGDGDTSMMVLGLNWLIAQQEAGTSNGFRPPAVANFSGWYATAYGDSSADVDAIERLINEAISKGVTFVTSANNHADATGYDACSTRPAAVPRAITVGGTRRRSISTGYDSLWVCGENGDFCPVEASGENPASNTGPCVDIFAPAHLITTADLSTTNYPGSHTITTSPTATLATENDGAVRHTSMASGTSFAAPQVAGVAAYYLSHHNRASPTTVWDYIRANATTTANNGTVPPVTNLPADNAADMATPVVMLFSRFHVATSLEPFTKRPDDADPLTNEADDAVDFRLAGTTLPTTNVMVGSTTATTVNTVNDPILGQVAISFTKPASTAPAGSRHAITLGGSSDPTIFPRGFLVRPNDVTIGSATGEVSEEVWRNVSTFMRYRITDGCGTGGTGYCGNQEITRAQMAVFILRSNHGETYRPPAAKGDVFHDVDGSIGYDAWIEQLYKERITAGCGFSTINGLHKPNYCPNNTIPREQMAVFVIAAKLGFMVGSHLDDATGRFKDVPTTSIYAKFIEALLDQGITVDGCKKYADGTKDFCPSAALTRYDMATWLVKAFQMQCGYSDGCPTSALTLTSDVPYPASLDGKNP